MSNFALVCARPIVEAFDGRLIYAGGDDVVALLPANTGLACAEALLSAFTGQEVKGPGGDILFRSPAPGYLSTDQWKDDHGRGRPIPFIVPGSAADASVGIAIAHFKSPLQDVVRAAQAAEKRAKNQLGRSAVAITLFKRSGETIEWGCKWNGGGLELYRAVADALGANRLSSKFPYRVVELLEPYRTSGRGLARQEDADAFDAAAVIHKEFAHAVSRQSSPGKASLVSAELDPILTGFLANLAAECERLAGESKRPVESKGQVLLGSLIGLMQTVAFANRTRSETATES